MRKFLVACAAALACSSAIFAGSTGGRLSAAGSAAAEADATAGGREPKIANPGSGGCPGGNCPAPNTPSNPPAGGSYGYYYPGWSWGNPYGWSWGYLPAKSQLTQKDEQTEPKEEKKMNGTAVTDKKETEPRETAPDTPRGGGHLVFSRYPGDPGRNEFVLADRDGRALAFIRLYWRDPKDKNRVGVSVNDGEVDGIKTWRQEIWTEMRKDLEGEDK